MAARGGPTDRRRDRSGQGDGRWTVRTDRSAILGVSLTVVVLLSLFAAPVGGAPPVDAGPSLDSGSSGGNGDDGAMSANSGGSGSGGDEGGDGGDESEDDEDGDSGPGDQTTGGASDAGGQSADSGDTGGEEADGSQVGPKEPNAGDGSNDGSTGNGATPAHSNVRGNDANGASSGGGGPPDNSNAGRSDGEESPGPPEHSKAGGDGTGLADENGDGPDAGPPEHSNAGGDEGEGPSVTVSTGNGDRGTTPGRSGRGAPSSVVEVSVTGVEAGDDVDLDVSPTSVENDAVAFEGISLAVKRDGDFTMRVTNSREPLPGSPAFDPEEAAESLGRIRLDHSITNEEVEEVSYTFRVSKAHLRATGTDFEEVALYRHANGQWSELPTDVVGETETHYVLSADSPGMSEFAVGAKRPDFDAYWADVEAGSVDAGETVTVSGRVTNHGGADGVYEARLVVDGEVVERRWVTIAAGGTRQVNFETTMERPGERAVAINDVAAGEVTVTARRAESRSASVDEGLAVVFDRLLDVGQALGFVSTSDRG